MINNNGMGKSSSIVKTSIKSSSLWSDAWLKLRSNSFAITGLIILIIVIMGAIFAPWISPYDPNEMNLRNALQSPGSPGHILGTDELGRDTLSRLIFGSRISLSVGLIVVIIAGSIGVVLGAISGYYGGVIDQVIMRIVDVLFAFPFLILAIAVVSIVGGGLTNVMITLGLVSWISYARLVRGMVLSLREEEFVISARVMGVKSWRIIWRHILPNTLGIVIVQATYGAAVAILSASALSFLGMGAQPPTAEWGAMLSTAKQSMRQEPILAIAPGLAIMITVLAINFVGDALRDALDPKLMM
jgi:peptide/nickel transport system permease protein